jgi:hypothetical protein
MAKTRPNPMQDPLFPTAGGEFFLPQAEASNEVQPLVRNLQLVNVLDYFTEIARLETFIKYGSTKDGKKTLAKQYGGQAGAEDVLLRSQLRRVELDKAAKLEYMRAEGLFVELDAGKITQRDAWEKARSGYRSFAEEYGFTHQNSQRAKIREELLASVRQRQDLVTSVRKKSDLSKGDNDKPNPIDDQLDTWTKLQVIKNDPRAGFIPATNHEKTIVLAWLDYLDNPVYPFGIRNQTIEIYLSQIAKHGAQGRDFGVQAAVSRAYELQDILTDAEISLQLLKAFQLEVADTPNPDVYLEQEFGESHPAYAVLIRFRDLRELALTGTVEGLRGSALRSTRNEEAVPDELIGQKNKVIEGPYTSLKLTKAIARRIKTQPKKLKVGDVRNDFEEAIADQEMRRDFARARLEDMATGADEKDELLLASSTVARSILGLSNELDLVTA